MDVGARLREARQRQGLTLGDISASTKVPTRILALLEHNRFNQLPAGIVTRGYLRAYAAKVGVDPRPLVAHYLVQRFGGDDENLPIAPPSPVEGDTPGGRHPLLETLVIVLAIVLFQLYRYAVMPIAAPSIETITSTAAPELASLGEAAVPTPCLPCVRTQALRIASACRSTSGPPVRAGCPRRLMTRSSSTAS